MQTKSMAQMVVLAAVALASTPALAAHGKHGTHHKPTLTTRKSEPSSRSRGVKKMEEVAHAAPVKHAKPIETEHNAEPSETPKLAASLSEPMVFRTDSQGRPRMKRTVSHETPEARPVTALDKQKDEIAPKGEGSSKPTAEGEEKHLLTRKAAASPKTTAKEDTKPPCLHDPMTFLRGSEQEDIPLTRCDGSVAPLAIERLSVLVRPESAQKPGGSLVSLAKAKGTDLAPGIRRLDPGMVERLQLIADHFGKKGAPAKASIISGYRPTSTGSYHATGQAIDMRVEGVANETFIAFCKTLPDTGCGYYPNSSFVHIDVRKPGTGHVYWVDTSGPGETPHYVSSWPPPVEAPPLKDSREANAEVMTKLDHELPPLPVDEHPAAVKDPAASMADKLDVGEEKDEGEK